MKLLNEILRTIHAMRRAGDIDIERLCFEVSPAEWQDLMLYFDKIQGFHGPSYGDVARTPGVKSMTVYGITVRERPA